VPGLTEDSLIITSAALVDNTSIARIVNWPEPFRYLNWHKDTKVSVDVVGERVEVSARHPVKGLLLYVDNDV
jgi:beta-mannosidase